MSASFDLAQMGPAAPLFLVIVSGLMVLLFEAFAGGRSRSYLSTVTMALLGAALIVTSVVWKSVAGDQVIFSGMLTIDRTSMLFDATFLAGGMLTALVAGPFMREHEFEFGEFYALLLFSVAGMMMMAEASDLLTLFIALEAMSLGVYVLTGSWRRSNKSSEGAMKYFLNGAFASGFMLYGIALIYGATGTTNYAQLSAVLAKGTSGPLLLVGMLLLLAGLAFKVAAVPFHQWAPDAYEGAPTPVTGFMSTGVKAAAFAALLRIFGGSFNKDYLALQGAGWANALSIMAVLTMTLGNLGALRQDNVKRMLAYSSISHAGYLLLGVVATSLIGNEARGPMLFYLVAYTFTTIGAFAIVAWMGQKGDEKLKVDDWAGLASKHPAMALAFTLFLLSLGGIPPTAGFFGKFYVFRAAIEKPGMVTLVIVAVINSAISIYYYLRLVTVMYFRELGSEPKPLRSPALYAAVIICVIATLVFGLLPGTLSDLTSSTAAVLAK